MDEPAWWPIGIALSSSTEAFADGQLRTSYGRTVLWDFHPFLAPEGWPTDQDEGTFWGDWPTEVETVETVSISQNCLVLLLN